MASVHDPNDTSGRLIAADQVEGTSIYNPAGESLGSVEDVLIDKVSGKIAYAIVGFGGFLGIGDRHYPLPWEKLKYRYVDGWVCRRSRSARPGRGTVLCHGRNGRLGRSGVGQAGLRLLRRPSVLGYAIIGSLSGGPFGDRRRAFVVPAREGSVPPVRDHR